MDDETLTAADFSSTEQSAWEVAIRRGLSITRADLRALLAAAGCLCDCERCEAIRAERPAGVGEPESWNEWA